MEFKVGSLASLISGSKSPAAAKKSKLFQNVSEGKINIKFQAMHNSEKERGKIKATDEFSGSYVLSNAYRSEFFLSFFLIFIVRNMKYIKRIHKSRKIPVLANLMPGQICREYF